MHTPRRSALSLALPLVLAAALATPAAHAGPTEDARAGNALRVLTEIQAIPESSIPEKLLDEAKAIVIIPDTIKAGLVVGGRRGRGVLAVRTADGGWSNPSFVTLTGGSIGLQVGVQSADVVLVFRSERGLDSIVNGKFTLGADAGVAAGPMGRNAAAATDGQMKAEIWSWSRARGLFAGVSLDGAVLSIDDEANAAVYGRDTTPRMIFEDRAPELPSQAIVDFRQRLADASATARAARQDTAPTDVAATAVPAADAAPATQPQAQPQAFETVENPAKVEPLPDTP
ncbi:lipid-binding SYLF domain-containing protein [Lysobacter brunescens]|uniref:Lipid-binding SYLF domain-containing protein n=1 Tax=Lysobacter brunescens TaxID=262323 RepID=A0ABW2YE88_9GAMM